MSLHAAYDPDNIFARILRGEIPAVKVWEDDHVLAFMDVFPQSEGHVLLVSKASTARTLLEIEPKALGRLIGATQMNGSLIHASMVVGLLLLLRTTVVQLVVHLRKTV